MFIVCFRFSFEYFCVHQAKLRVIFACVTIECFLPYHVHTVFFEDLIHTYNTDTTWWKKWRMNIKMFDILASNLKHNNRFLHLRWTVQNFIVQISWRSIKKRGFLFYWIKSNWKHTCIQSYVHLAINVFKAIYNYPTFERFIFPCA